MITLNLHYLTKNSQTIIERLEKAGFTVATVDEVDEGYEDDQRREFRQNLGCHDWNTEDEWHAMYLNPSTRIDKG